MKSREIRAGEMTKSRVPRETISVLLSGFSSGASLSKRTCKNKRFLCKSLTFLFFLSLFFFATARGSNAQGTQRSWNVKEILELNQNAGKREMARAIALEGMSTDLTSRVNLSGLLVARLNPRIS